MLLGQNVLFPLLFGVDVNFQDSVQAESLKKCNKRGFTRSPPGARSLGNFWNSSLGGPTAPLPTQQWRLLPVGSVCVTPAARRASALDFRSKGRRNQCIQRIARYLENRFVFPVADFEVSGTQTHCETPGSHQRPSSPRENLSVLFLK